MSNFYIIFNPSNKLPIFFTIDQNLVKDCPLVKTIDATSLGITDNNFNLNRYKWIGDYDTGYIQDTFLDNRTIVTEEEIDGNYRDILLRKYPLDKILCSIINNMSFTDDQEFNSIKSFIHNLTTKKKKDIEFYTNSQYHKFETWDDIINREQELFKQ